MENSLARRPKTGGHITSPCRLNRFTFFQNNIKLVDCACFPYLAQIARPLCQGSFLWATLLSHLMHHLRRYVRRATLTFIKSALATPASVLPQVSRIITVVYGHVFDVLKFFDGVPAHPRLFHLIFGFSHLSRFSNYRFYPTGNLLERRSSTRINGRQRIALNIQV
jgi:hypothetical protein